MGSVVIVALPDPGERVMEVSSEKKPHLTMLYLGDDLSGEELAHIAQHVEHVASQLQPFYLTVDHRGLLGEDNADVVFFEDDSFDMKAAKQFRHNLLLDDTIRKAYNQADQFPNWTPHLTLGYPKSPAKETDDSKRLYAVQFDRIGLWFGDYEGPEFRMKHSYLAENMAMSSLGSLAVEKLLSHANDIQQEYVDLLELIAQKIDEEELLQFSKLLKSGALKKA